MNSRGFSLIELLLTLSLIAILMSYGYKSYNHSRISVEAEIDRQYVLKIPILLEENYSERLIYPAQLGDILDSSNNSVYTPKSYYRVIYKRTSNTSYQLSARLNLKNNGANLVTCARMDLDENGVIKGFDKAGNAVTSSCWK